VEVSILKLPTEVWIIWLVDHETFLHLAFVVC
jgi:hypothetical protein